MYRLRAAFLLGLLAAVAQCQTEYEWRIEDYGECSGTECENGWRFRQVTCVIVGTDSVQSESNCGLPKPSNWQQCSVGECEGTQIAVSNVVYEWVEGDWQTCTVTCGGGVQNRFVGCTADGRAISTVFCEGLDNLGQMPATSQSCNVIECSGETPGVRYYFYAGDWEECSAECDGGVQSRRVLCVGQDSTYAYQASEEECTIRGLEVPISEQPCNMHACDPASRTTNVPPTTQTPRTTAATPPMTQPSGSQVRYIEGSFSACSATCGYATRTRHVLCVQTLNGVHMHVDDSVCKEPKPEETVVCEGLQPCPDAATPTTEPSTLAPTMVPITTTIAPSTTLVYQQTTLYIIGEPTTEYVADPSIERPTYVVGQFGLCDCSTRQKNRYVICVDYRSDSVVMIAEKHCIATGQQKPYANEDCDAGECPGTAAPPLVTEWSRTLLGGCSKTCGGGVQRFEVECFDTATSQPVSEEHCDVALRPLDTAECATNQCEDDKGSFWSIGSWSECSVTCGTGEQTRPVTCYYYIGGPTTDISTECDIPTKPATTQQCGNRQCNGYWVSSEWSECSASCGFGVQSRTVDCRWEKTDLIAIDDSQCSGSKPATQTGCKIDECPINYDCGNMLEGSAGNISSPSYPYNYPNDVICRNVIVADDSGNDVYVEIDFQVLEIEDETDCSFDYIEVYDMKTGMRDRICRAQEMPMKWTSSGNMVEVTFVSDASVNKKGFSALWTRMEKETTV